jgi:hypothetical protein
VSRWPRTAATGAPDIEADDDVSIVAIPLETGPTSGPNTLVVAAATAADDEGAGETAFSPGAGTG